MAAIATKYAHLWKLVVTGQIDLDTDTIKIALVTSSYSPSTAHTQWADVSANEVANGNGYTTGGITLTTPVTNNSNFRFANPKWTALTKTFRYLVCYKLGSGGGLTNPLLFYVLADSTPADIISNGSDYEGIWNTTDGIFYTA